MSKNSMSSHMNGPGRILRLALAANALFSIICGVVLVFAYAKVAQATGLPSSRLILPLIGTSLVAWGLFAGWQAARQALSKGLAVLTSAGDGIWVLATLILLPPFRGHLTTLGVAVVALIALIVAIFGAAQLYGVRKLEA